MMRRHLAVDIGRLLALTGVLTLATASPSVAEKLVISISRHQVLVNSSFTGTQIVLFGTIEPDSPTARMHLPYDLVATLIGPRETVVTRRKERMFGIWANVASRTFVNVPSYLGFLSNKPYRQIADIDILRRVQVGLDNFLLPQQIGPDIADVVRDDPLRVNFIRLKMEHALYLEAPNGVTFLTPTVFRAEIPLPAQAPFGSYEVQVKLFAQRALLTTANSAFEVVKVGFEQFVATAAHDYSALYGISAAMMAVLTGWLAGVAFRRD
jgi:uncharacterized protein (TIGR02186 family)